MSCMVLELSAWQGRSYVRYAYKKGYLFPILSAECDYDTGNTDAEVRKCASEGNKFGIYLLVLME
jgi:hypothetical protein